MTLHGARFSDEGAGINVCCMSSHIDAEEVYDVVISKSDRLNTFMQRDTLTMNLGSVTNTGHTVRSESQKFLKSCLHIFF